MKEVDKCPFCNSDNVEVKEDLPELRIKEWIDGNDLYTNGENYVCWSPGHKKITLDGNFSAKELKEIVAFMKAKG